ncbi:MAG: hypothetical protein R3F59_12710 [Myxococcota bacterium]
MVLWVLWTDEPDRPALVCGAGAGADAEAHACAEAAAQLLHALEAPLPPPSPTLDTPYDHFLLYARHVPAARLLAALRRCTPGPAGPPLLPDDVDTVDRTVALARGCGRAVAHVVSASSRPLQGDDAGPARLPHPLA